MAEFTVRITKSVTGPRLLAYRQGKRKYTTSIDNIHYNLATFLRLMPLLPNGFSAHLYGLSNDDLSQLGPSPLRPEIKAARRSKDGLTVTVTLEIPLYAHLRETNHSDMDGEQLYNALRTVWQLPENAGWGQFAAVWRSEHGEFALGGLRQEIWGQCAAILFPATTRTNQVTK